METRRTWLVGAGLFVVTMALYWPATSFPFVNFDDQLYIYENPEVLKGLSWQGIKWVATNAICANWHPLTMLSHMFDCSVFGTFAGGHHLTNIFLHATNALLLWLLLKRLTGLFWPGALVAALFAWHPINVESVAWISERKNLLSGLFLILTVWTYLRHVEQPNPLRYSISLILFGLGLAAKPMLVTLPFLLLLLDYWPLRRIGFDQPTGKVIYQKQTWLLIGEKIPFFLLSLADCIITYKVQETAGAVNSLGGTPIEFRLLNIPVAYGSYLAKLFWPTDLSVFYDFPTKLPIMAAVCSTIVLGAVTFVAWQLRSGWRWLFVGWFWFLGTLVPVIGLVQVGSQSMADRYAYLPSIGLFLIMACGLNGQWISRPHLRNSILIALVTLLSLCLASARKQIMVWQNSVDLFTQATAANPNSASAHKMLARALSACGRQTEAIKQYTIAVRLNPHVADLQYDLGRELISANRFVEAQQHLSAALALDPNNPVYVNTHGVALMMSGQPDAAVMKFTRASELQPDYAKPYFNLGKIFLKKGQNHDAITNFDIALKLQPDWPEALENLASAHAAMGDTDKAVSLAVQALNMATAGHQQSLAERIACELKVYQNTLNSNLSTTQYFEKNH